MRCKNRAAGVEAGAGRAAIGAHQQQSAKGPAGPAALPPLPLALVDMMPLERSKKHEDPKRKRAHCWPPLLLFAFLRSVCPRLWFCLFSGVHVYRSAGGWRAAVLARRSLERPRLDHSSETLPDSIEL